MNHISTSPRHWSFDIQASELQTPAYVYSASEVARRIKKLKECVGTTVLISFKACPNYDVIFRLPEECFEGVELASRGELHMFAGLRPEHFYVNTPALNESLARSAIGAKASFLIDSPEQLELIGRIRGKREVCAVTLRLSNRLILATCPGAPTFRLDQFGMDLEAAYKAIDLARSMGIKIEGLHLYSGPHTFGRASKYVIDTLEAIIPLVEQRMGYPLRMVNLGGGLEEGWEDKGYDFAYYREQQQRLPARLKRLHEFGRAIFATAGVFAVRVTAIKAIQGQRYAICDGGLAQAFLLAQTENVFRKYRTPWVHGTEIRKLRDDKTIIVGST